LPPARTHSPLTGRRICRRLGRMHPRLALRRQRPSMRKTFRRAPPSPADADAGALLRRALRSRRHNRRRRSTRCCRLARGGLAPAGAAGLAAEAPLAAADAAAGVVGAAPPARLAAPSACLPVR
jgi:hypothetical protein